MPIPIRFRQEVQAVSGHILETFDGVAASFEGVINAEHNPDGTHKSVNASAIMLGGESVDAIVTRTPTLADVDNTATATDYLTFTIPANKMGDGDFIRTFVYCDTKQNQGGAQTFTHKLGWGSTTLTLASGVSVNDNAAEGSYAIKYELFREGLNLYVAATSAGGGLAGGGEWANNDFLVMTPDFTVRSTVRFELTLSVADADFYLRPLVAIVEHLRIV